ncbi:FtsK/SpoIIIE domain-containing protein [Streptomyces sp. 71268]|uniref:FtsK/SpoIIIE domain-containing protein n=1 Tax=Streptomyces sp. 71268 TaxID=3002640 RepID=UPI0023F83892|nr:FtsK/SpoIIIE domain-containing protein [Streptomyces sp. 71268]WEV27518.1 FtsK/SpoIIIE domain-containing protein [Streptomyces sp. 71268]
MQIRLTVLGPRSGLPGHQAHACDVLVTAPVGTALASVTSGLAAAVAAAGADVGSGTVAVYAGAERLDARRCVLGEPPLVDGAVLALQAPAAPEEQPHPYPALCSTAPARLHVVAGPDAGGVHLLHGGQARIGRSSNADVPLDDPDVSRAHCAVSVSDDGRVTVVDLGSTNGTHLDGMPVGDQPAPLPPGALLRIGESALRLHAPPPGLAPHAEPAAAGQYAAQAPAGAGGQPSGWGAGPAPLATHPDGEGHLRVAPGGRTPTEPTTGAPTTDTGAGTRAGAGSPPTSPGGTAADPPDTYGYGGPGQRSAGAAPAPAPNRGYDTAPGGARSEAGHAAPPPADPRGLPGGAGPTGYATGAGGPAYPATGDPGATRRMTRPGAHGAEGFDRWPGPEAADGYDVPTHSGDLHAPRTERRRTGLGAWARRLAGGGRVVERADSGEGWGADPAGVVREAVAAAEALDQRWPDPSSVLLTALGPDVRLWERTPCHPDALVVRLGTADQPLAGAPGGPTVFAPVAVSLREAGAVGLAGPRARLTGLARSVIAQLAAAHPPTALEIVLISAERQRPVEERLADWSWLGWLPQVRPAHGQDCRLLLAFDRDQAAARVGELVRRLDDGPLGPGWITASPSAVAAAAKRHTGPHTVVIVDGEPAQRSVRERVARLAAGGPAAGVHLLCLAEAPPAATGAPLSASYEAARSASSLIAECGVVALLSGDVATELKVLHRGWDGDPGRAHAPSPPPLAPRPGVPSSDWFAAHGLPARSALASGGQSGQGSQGGQRPAPAAEYAGGEFGGGAGTTGPTGIATPRSTPTTGAGAPGPGGGASPDGAADAGSTAPDATGVVRTATVDAVSLAWAERFARALAPLRPVDAAAGGLGGPARASAPLPDSTRLLDELGLARATPASLMARWAAADDEGVLGGRTLAVLGAGPRGPLAIDLAADGPHLLIDGAPGTGKTELLRSIAASLAAAERPDRMSLVLVDGGGVERGEGLRPCTELPHVSTYLAASDPVRMREFAQALSSELKRRAELLGRGDFLSWHAENAAAPQIIPPRRPMDAPDPAAVGPAGFGEPEQPGHPDPADQPGQPDGRWGAGYAPDGGLESPAGGTLKLRAQPVDGGQGGVGTAADAGQSGGEQPQDPYEPGAMPRLVVLVDDFDALVAPALGSTGRPSAGSVVRALEAVARDGARLGVHLIAASGRPDRTADTVAVERAGLRVLLEQPSGSVRNAVEGLPNPGRGRLKRPDDGGATPFQAGRVTGRIPRTATARPTVVPLDWERMGDPPTRRPLRELGNGPTDLALLASALQRAAQSTGAPPAPPLI